VIRPSAAGDAIRGRDFFGGIEETDHLTAAELTPEQLAIASQKGR
jgi:hypothetical protein